MKRRHILVTSVLLLALGTAAPAQTNLQVFYDFGKDRHHVTTTLEGFYNDSWGNTFFFVDHYYNSRDAKGRVEAPSGTYFEIERCLNFWNDTPLSPLSLYLEYQGGVYQGFNIKNSFLCGVDYFLHSKDFRRTLNLKVLYKYIHSGKSDVPLQFSAVWGMKDLFGVKGLRFSGFMDFWREDHILLTEYGGTPLSSPRLSHAVFLTEPQLWYNVGQFFGVNNLNLGGEVECSFDFGTVQGFCVRPCLGAKWVF